MRLFVSFRKSCNTERNRMRVETQAPTVSPQDACRREGIYPGAYASGLSGRSFDPAQDGHDIITYWYNKLFMPT